MKVVRTATVVLLLLVALWVIAWTVVSSLAGREVTLPNGMVLRRVLDATLNRRDDLFSADGRTRLARDVEFVCFDDRYVYLAAFEPGDTGLYESATDWKAAGDRIAGAAETTDLFAATGGCDGYFSAWIGPALLYDEGRVPHRPLCRSRNLQNTALRRRDWFDRPCTPEEWPTSGG